MSRLADAGLLVRPRYSDRDPGQVTGYAVALPGDRSREGRPVWFGGRRLAADLSWPKLATRWPDTAHRAPDAPAEAAGGHGPSGRRRPAVRTGQVPRLGRRHARWPPPRPKRWHASPPPTPTPPPTWRTPPPTPCPSPPGSSRAAAADRSRDAADAYDRAARDLHGRTPPRDAGRQLVRAVARLLALTGRASKDETAQVLALVANLAALADAVAQLRARPAASCPGRGRSRRRRPPHPRHPARPPPPRTAAAAVHRPAAVACRPQIARQPRNTGVDPTKGAAMTRPTTPTTPISPSLDAARHALAAVLDTTRAPRADDRDRLAAAEALAVLSDVRPPYPPPTPERPPSRTSSWPHPSPGWRPRSARPPLSTSSPGSPPPP